jgi:hypothetical protein
MTRVIVLGSKLKRSPVILQQNWINECEKFFDPTVLRAKAWTLSEWIADSDIHTVWIVKISWLQPDTAFWRTMDASDNVKILSTFADEAHLFGRSSTSTQNFLLRKLTSQSNFNVLITGTIFPLGPEMDSCQVLQSLAGPFDENGRWPPVLRKAIKRMLEPPEHENSVFTVLALRILIAPFVLRRTTASTWKGEWVIKRTIVRPIPQLLEPYPDEHTEAAAKAEFRRKKATETQHSIIERADKQRFFAWTPIYAMYVKLLKDRGVNEESERVRLMEQLISKNLRKQEGTGRVRRFIAWVKSVHDAGERFIVVSDRLFPLVLTYYVCFMT